MKTKLARISKRSLSFLLSLLMIVSIMTVGTITAFAGGTNWNANIFFRVPDSWNLSTYPNVQAWAVQSSSASSGTKYAFLLGNMSVAGTTSNSRLYHAWVSANHSGWGNTEYIAFTANTSNWGTGDFYISTCGQYTAPLNYGATNSNGSYLFSPSNASNNTATNNNTISGAYNGSNRDVLKKNQDFYVYTNGASGAAGGSVAVTAHYVNGSSYSGSSAIASSSITVDSSDSGAHEQYGGAVQGTKVTMTATAATGYDFDGYYTAATGGSLISSNATYSYYVFGTKSVYARFKLKTYTITYNKGANGTGTVASTTKTHGVNATLSSSTFTRSGYTQKGWSTSDGGSKAYNLGGTYSTNADATLYPYWEQNTHQVSASSSPSNGTLKFSTDNSTWVDGPITVAEGATYYVKATPSTGYKIKSFTVGGSAVSGASGNTSAKTYTGTMSTSDVTAAASFAIRTFNVKKTETGASGGTVKVGSTTIGTSNTSVNYGTNYTVTVDAPDGYKVSEVSGITGTTTGLNTASVTITGVSITATKTIAVTYVSAGTCAFDLSASSATLNIGGTTTFTATPNGYHSSGTISAESDDTDVATVSKDGNTYTVTAVAPGTATITVSCTDTGNTPSTFSVTVNSPSVSAFSYSTANATIGSSSVAPSITTTNPSNSSSLPSGWSIVYSITGGSDNATISSSTGVLACRKAGSVTVKASLRYNNSEKASKTTTFTVSTPTVQFGNTAAVSLNIGGTTTRTATGSAVGTVTSDTITYISSATDKATVSSGVITGVAAGAATISATRTIVCDGKTTTCSTSTNIAVTVNAPTIAVTGKTGLKIGETWSPSPTLTNPSSTGSGWTVVYTKTSGTATTISGSTITGDTYNTTGDTYKASYQYNGVEKASTTFTVKTADPTISMTTTGQTLAVDGTYTRTATGGNIGSGATGSVSYSSGTPAVASVNSSTGQVTAKTPGTSVITATYTVKIGNVVKATKTATYTVTVSDPTVTITSGNKVAVGDTLSLTATSSAASPTFTWAVTSGNAYATVSGSTLTGQAAGSATVQVTATYANGYTKTATKAITVEAPAITVKDGSTSVADGTVYTTVGTNKALTVGQNFSDALTAKSANTSVATVSLNNGTLTITPVAKGTTKVSVSTDSDYTPSNSAFNSPLLALSKTKLLLGAVNTTTVTFTVNVAEADTNHYVYFSNGGNWSSPTIHAWGSSGTQANRQAMTKIGVNDLGQDVYAYKFSSTDWANVQNIHFLSSAGASWSDSSNTDNTHTFTGNELSHTGFYNDGTYDLTIVKPQIQANDVTIDMGSTQTMTATVLTSGTPSTFNWSSGTASVATTADTHTASNVITGVAPGTSTITVKAYAEKPSGWASIVTDGTADAYVAGTTTATATVVAENKTVTFGAKKTDDGSTWTNGGGTLTATYTTGGGGGGSTPAGDTLYLWWGSSGAPSNYTNDVTMEQGSDGNYYATLNGSRTYYFVINDSSTSYSSGTLKINSSTTSSNDGSFDWADRSNYSTYQIGRCQLLYDNRDKPVYIKYDPTGNGSIRFQTTSFSYTPAGGGSGSGGGSDSSSGTIASGETVPYNSNVTFTAAASYTANEETYQFIGWYSTAQPANNETALSTSTTYTVNSVTSDLTVYARYKKSCYLTFYNSYMRENEYSDWKFVAAPPRTVTVGQGSSVRATYSYKAGNAEQRGEDHTKNSTSDYYEGNRLLVLVGETVTLKYSTLASSDAIRGIFFNNEIRYTTETEPDNLYKQRVKYTGEDDECWGDEGDDEWQYTYLPATTIYADENYYSGATATTIHNNSSSYVAQNNMDQSTHTVSWVATQSYMNIDLELDYKYQLHINDDKPDGISIANMNDEGYYYGGEIIESTTPNHTNGLKITLDNTTDTTGTYSFSSATPVWKDKDGNTVSAPSGVTAKAYTSGNAETNTPSSIHHWLIYGTMPHSDIYVTLPVEKKYNMKLANIVVSDNGSSKRTMITECGSNSTSATDCIGTISGKVNGTTQATLTDDGTYYTYPSNNNAGHVEAYTSNTNNKYLNGGVNRNGYNVTAGQTVTYTFSFSSGKDAEYTFVGWFEGTYNNVSNTDFSYDVNYNKKLSGKESFTFTPSKNTVVIAVATRDMYIGGNFTNSGTYTSTSASQTWASNRPLMEFDPTYVNPEDPTKKGRYYYTFDSVSANTEYKFRCYDSVSGTEFGDLSVWNTWLTHDNGGSTGYNTDNTDIALYRDKYDAGSGNGWTSHGGFMYTTATNKKITTAREQGGNEIGATHNISENHQANGYAAPVTVYFYAYDGGMSVSSTYQWSRAYVSEGRGVDVKSVSGGTTTYNSPTASVANKTVNNKDVTVTTNTTSYGHDGMTEKIYECIVKEKDGQIVVTASPKDQNLELQAFLVYNIETKASEAVKGPFTTSGSGDDKTYTGNIKIPNNSKIYVCPIYKFTDAYISAQNLESHNVFVRADDIDKDDWGGLVSMYSWGTTSGYDSGGWPGQLMVPSDDGTSFYAPLVFQKGGLAGVTFNNYTQVYGGDFINFLGKYQDAGVSDVAYSNYTKPSATNNYIYQVFDYREPISIIENINDGDIYDSEDMTLTFALKPGNKTTATIGSGAYNDSFNFEYLTDSSGKYRVDLNGNKLSTYPTASYYVVCNYTEAYAPGGSKTYDFATSTHNRYSIDWNVYDQNHVLVANGTQLSAAFTDVEKSEMLTYIAKQLIDDGQPVSGKAVKIAYENPKVSSSDKTEAVRYSGQWYADGLNTIIKGNVRVGIYSDGVYTPSDSNSAGYGTATVGFTPDTTIGEGYETETGCSGHSLANVTKTHASNGDVQYTVSSTDNFLGWYRKTKDGDFEPIGSNYKSQAINPSFNEDITLYAFYSASASYRFAYTSRTGSTKYYTAKGTDLTDAELANSGTLNPTTRSADITAKLAGVTDIKVFNHDLTYALTSPDTSSPYTITYTAGDSPSTYTLTVYAYNSSGTLAQVGSKTGTWNTSLDVNNDLTTYASGFTKGSKLVNNKPSDHGNYIFLGWRKYNGSAFEGPIISTKENFGYSITSDTTIAPYFVDPTDNTTINNYISEAWKPGVDNSVVTQELTKEGEGVIFNDNLISFRYGSDTNKRIDGSSIYSGDPNTVPEGKQCGVVVLAQANDAAADKKTAFNTHYNTDTNIQSYVNYFVTGAGSEKSSVKMSSSKYGDAYAFHVKAPTLSNLNRANIVQALDYAKFSGGNYKVMSYYYDGSSYVYSDVTSGTLTCS